MLGVPNTALTRSYGHTCSSDQYDGIFSGGISSNVLPLHALAREPWLLATSLVGVADCAPGSCVDCALSPLFSGDALSVLGLSRTSPANFGAADSSEGLERFVEEVRKALASERRFDRLLLMAAAVTRLRVAESRARAPAAGIRIRRRDMRHIDCAAAVGTYQWLLIQPWDLKFLAFDMNAMTVRCQLPRSEIMQSQLAATNSSHSYRMIPTMVDKVRLGKSSLIP